MSVLGAVIAAWLIVPLSPLATRVFGRFAGWPLAALMLVPLGLLAGARITGEGLTFAVAWIPTIDVHLRLRLDGLSLLFSLLVLGIGAVVLVYSSSYLRSPRSPGFYALMTGFAASMLTLVVADDMVLMFVSWEFTTLCSYLLILRSGPQAKGPATRTLLVTVGGGLSLLGAVALIIATTGTTHLTAALQHEAWSTDPVFATTAAALVAVAAMTKSAQFPFHSWLPDAMVAPAPVSAYLHAAAMVKAGIYLLLLFAPAAAHSALWPVVLISVGLLTSVMGGVFALAQDDIKKLMAYSTVSQLGLIVAVIGVGTDAAMIAASAHVLAHALFKAAGFMAVGMIEKRTGTRDLRELRGLWRTMRLEMVLLILALASMAAVIPTFGFVSKELILEAFLHSPWGEGTSWMLALVVAGGAVFTVAYSARMVLPVLGGERMTVAPRREYAAMTFTIGLTALLGTVGGLAIGLLSPIVHPAAAAASPQGGLELPGLHLWHGLTAALLLSAATWVLGGAVAVIHGRRLAAGAAVPTFPVQGTAVVQGVHDGIIRLGHRVGGLTRFDSTAGQLAIPLTIIGSSVLVAPLLWRGMPPFHSVTIHDLLLTVMLAVGLVAVIGSVRRLTAVVSASIIGFGVVLWFFVLGASDVAMTQLTVEILTVVVMVLVVRRMSTRFPRTSRSRSVAAAVAAVLVGSAATLATLVFTGHRDLSTVGEYFLREAEELTGGTNVVNTILVDFRALDTFGEMVVLALASVSLTALLQARPLTEGPPARTPNERLADPVLNSVFLRVAGRVLIPVMVVVSIIVLLRGHNATGGGFIAALIGAGVIGYVYLAAPSDAVRALRLPYLGIAGAGIVVAAVTGLVGVALEGSFLRAVHADILGYHFTTALVFDLGVYLAVLGVILGAVSRLGTGEGSDSRSEVRSEVREGAVEEAESTGGQPATASPPGRDADRRPAQEVEGR
ncbi:hydrogen gas-evolving membrane-bound hydrogenase subunit E [Brachybacterium sp. AOP43-C2-M15]|uniref:hydrogen gas-evolving membrane-bound hydrogenase subunit E n=1 Tax=Brachybacterium sp. AOP43-C2-M15 TaxID=3457661 RepID=UPI00403407A7